MPRRSEYPLATLRPPSVFESPDRLLPPGLEPAAASILERSGIDPLSISAPGVTCALKTRPSVASRFAALSERGLELWRLAGYWSCGWQRASINDRDQWCKGAKQALRLDCARHSCRLITTFSAIPFCTSSIHLLTPATIKLNGHWLLQAGVTAGHDVAPWTSDAKASGTACLNYNTKDTDDTFYVCANGINSAKFSYDNVQQYDAIWYHRFSRSWHVAREG